MNSGFTLIEMLVVIGILSMLVAMLLSYTDTHNAQISLYVDKIKVMGIVQRAKSLAFEKYAREGDNICALGVHFETSTREYFIYSVVSSTCSGITSYDYNASDSSSFKKEQIFSLSPRNYFESGGDIYFVPPYFTTTTSGQLTLRNSDTGKSVSLSYENNTIIDLGY